MLLQDASGKNPRVSEFRYVGRKRVSESKRTSSISAIIDFERSFFGDPLAAFVSALFIYDDVEKETDFIAGYNEVSKRPLILTYGDREKIILYEMLLYLRSYCETR